MARRAFTSHPLVVRRVTVCRIEDVTPRMRRIVVGGDGLAPTGDHAGFAAPGFDDHIKLVFASDGDLDAALPRQLEHGIEWTPSENRVTRDYTPRRVAADELDLDFVRHGDGPAASWAASARVGDELCFVGPKASVILPDELDWILLVADETGLPAVGRFLDERPTDAPAHIVVLVEDASARQELLVRDGDTIAWHVARGGNAAALDAAVRAVPLPDGEGYAWAAAESRALLPVRRYLQREAGIAKDRLNITGYWHLEDDAASDEPAAPEIASPVPWLVTRAALQLGLVDALADGAATLPELAERTGVDARSVAALLPVLSASGVVVEADGRLALAAWSLLDEHEREEFTGFEADLVLALAELAPAVRAGTSAWHRTTGRTLAESATDDAEIADELVEHAGGLAFLLDGFIADPVWQDVRSCLLLGPGASAVAGALEDARPDVVEVPSDADLAVLAHHLGHRTDAEAVAALADVAAPVAVVIEQARPDGLGLHAVEEHALALARTGAPVRDREAVAALAEEAGWRVTRVIELGWGVEASVLTRG